MLQPMINPYKPGPPVTGANFYGRRSLLSRVRDALNSANVILLQGQRRIGKTSFLKQLAAYLQEPDSEGRLITPLKPVIFDIQRYGQDTLPQFQLHLAEAIVKDLQLPVPKLADLEANPAAFTDQWLPQVYEHLGKKQLVILVDEFDNLDEQTAPQAIRTLIPFLSQLVMSELALKWVFVIGRWAGRLSIAHESITRSGVRFQISFFSREETRQLVEQPVAGMLTYQPESIDRIYQLTNGQPHLTQGLGYEIFQHVMLEEERDVVTVEDVEQVISQTLEAFGSAISSIVRIPLVEERVLAAVAKLTEEEQPTDRDQLIQLLLESHIPLTSAELTEALKNLFDWELLKGDDQKIQLSIELVRLWIVRNLSVEPNREESLDIQTQLAENRFEFAEKARTQGHYLLAIDNYQDALNSTSNHINALKGLAETYHLKGDSANRVEILKKLYSCDRSTQNELIHALEDYAQRFKEQGEYLNASKQYKALLKLSNRRIWRQFFLENLKEALIYELDKAEVTLNLEDGLNLKLISDDSTKVHSKIIELREDIAYAGPLLDKSEEIELNHFLEVNDHRMKLILTRLQFIRSYVQGKNKEVVRILTDLERNRIQLTSLEKEIMKEAFLGWRHNFGSFFFFASFSLMIVYLIISLYDSYAGLVEHPILRVVAILLTLTTIGLMPLLAIFIIAKIKDYLFVKILFSSKFYEKLLLLTSKAILKLQALFLMRKRK
jgi:tetratricopeptide (TPR) repeat protein